MYGDNDVQYKKETMLISVDDKLGGYCSNIISYI